MHLTTLLKKPSAFSPVAMSLAALATVLVVLATSGIPRGGDEGTPAHIWQLLMAAQAPIVAYFAITWLPRAPKQALSVLALQVLAALAALAPVFLLKL
jgi:hypothetical protein